MSGKLKPSYELWWIRSQIIQTAQNSILFCHNTQKKCVFHDMIFPWRPHLGKYMAKKFNSRLINVDVVIMRILVRAIPEGPAKAKNITYKLL